MPAVLDTHAAVWYATEPAKLSDPAKAAFNAATAAGEPIYIASISLVEIQYLQEKKRIPHDVMALVKALFTGTAAPFELVLLDEAVADRIPLMPRDDVPDMPDRIIASTAVRLGVPLVTCDRKIRAAAVRTIW